MCKVMIAVSVLFIRGYFCDELVEWAFLLIQNTLEITSIACHGYTAALELLQIKNCLKALVQCV